MIEKKSRIYVERYALSLLLHNDDCWMKYYNILSPKMFKSEPHQTIFKFLLAHSGSLTYKMLSHELRQRKTAIGNAGIIHCQTAFVKLKRFKYDVKESEYVFKTLVKYTASEDTFRWMKEYIELIEQGEVDRAEQLKLKHFLHSSSVELGIDRGEIVKDFKERLDLFFDKIQNPDKYKMCKTGIKLIDKAIGGFCKGEFALIAGHTSRGKSTIALNIAYRNQLRGNKILYFINEMPKHQVESKYDAISTKIPYYKFKFAKLSKDEIKLWERKVKNLDKFGGELHIISVAVNCTPNLIREMVKMHGDVDLVIVDSLLYMDPSNKSFSEQGDLGNITRDLKGIAVQFKIPVIGITQLSADSLEKESLDYADIGYSRKMSHISDIIVAIPNIQDEDDNSLTLQLVKNRDGKSNVFVKIYMNWETGRVNNVPDTSSGDDQNYPSSFED